MVKPNVKLLTMTALFAAMIAALTSFGHIPLGNGYVHMGDGVIYLAACILPFPYAIFAAVIGGGAADALSGYAVYIIPTMAIKALVVLPFSSKGDKILSTRNALMIFPAGIINIAGYFAVSLMLYGLPGTLFTLVGDSAQAFGSGILFIALAYGLDKIGFKRSVLRS